MLHKNMHIFEREVNGHRYRIAAQSVWDAERERSVARQLVLAPAEPPAVADLRATHTVGTRGVGDVGALICVAEQLDLVAHIDRACGGVGAKGGPSVGELAVAVAIQRACAPGPKRELGEFLDASLPRLSCLPGSAFSGQAFHRVAQQVTEHQLEQAQVAVAKAAVARFELSADVLAFDTTNFDTHIDTQTPGELARRGHAKRKRKDLRVVGLGVLVSETGHVPLLYRTYPGNGSDQAVLAACLGGLAQLHEALDSGEARARPAQRTLVRDGGFWSPQLELDLDTAGYYSLISLPLGHKAAEEALQMAAQRGAMKPLSGKLSEVRAARIRTTVAELDRTLVVVESQELLAGQKRGIAAALRKAKVELRTLEGLIQKGRISRSRLELRVNKALAREHLSSFVMTTFAGSETAPTLHWLARRCRIAPRAGEDAARPAGTVHRPTYLDHRSDCLRLPRSVESRGAVPQSEERRCRPLGAIAPVGRWVAAPAHLRDRSRVDAREPGEDRARNGRFRPSDDGKPG